MACLRLRPAVSQHLSSCQRLEGFSSRLRECTSYAEALHSDLGMVAHDGDAFCYFFGFEQDMGCR